MILVNAMPNTTNSSQDLLAPVPKSLHTFLRAFALRYWVNYSAAAAMLLTIVLLNAWIPQRVGELVDMLASRPGANKILIASVGLLLAAALIYLFRAGWRLFLFHAVLKLGVELRTQLYRQLSLQTAAFYQERRTGDLMAAATNDIDAVEAAAGEGALAGFDGATTLVIMIVALVVAVDWRLAAAVLLPFPVMAWAFKFISDHIHSASKDSLDAFGKLNDHTQETLAGIRTVRAVGLITRSEQEFSRRAAQAANSSLRAQQWEAAYEPAVGNCLVLSTMISLSLGAWLVWHDELSVGQLTSVGLYLGQLIWPMFALGWVMSLIQRGKAAWERLEPILNAPVQVVNSGTETTLSLPKITFKGVSFSHPGQSVPALNNIQFELPYGKSLGVVGATGSGKSTLIKLLLRQWNPDHGCIFWGDKPIEQIELQTLRQAIAWVAQEPFLFSATVAQNIALSRPSASQDEIEQAAQLAAVHDDIMRLPQQYQSPVGERGITLSGGQKQRVAIARAMLTKAPLLLLDDALSAVDTGTEAQILAHLRRQRQEHGQTSIVMSHRLSAVVECGHIIVLRKGVVIEEGSHALLLENNGWYARQWRYQQLQTSLDS
jgi:ATP-binding cassette, subfamily B, multidrug efflux pump